MADDETKPQGEPQADIGAGGRKEGLGDRLQHAEHSVEKAIKDTLTAAEIRMIQAGEAETSGSPEVNFASALEVALNPPHPGEADADTPDQADAPDAQPKGRPSSASGPAGDLPGDRPPG